MSCNMSNSYNTVVTTVFSSHLKNGCFYQNTCTGFSYRFLGNCKPVLTVRKYRKKANTAWKVPKYGVFSGPYFLAFGLNTERYSISLRIQSECGKIRTRKNSVFG